MAKMYGKLWKANKILSSMLAKNVDAAKNNTDPVTVDLSSHFGYKYILNGFWPQRAKGRRLAVAKAKKLRCKGCYDRIVEVKQLKREGQFYFNCLFVSHRNNPYRVEIWDISVGMITHERTRITNLRTNKQFEKLIKDGTVTGWIPAFLNQLSWPVIEKAFKVLKKLEAK